MANRSVLRLEPGRFAAAAADFLAGLLRHLGDAGPFTVGLSGGRTPEPVFERLARLETVPWQRAEIFFADERCVPPEHPASNYRMVHASLLSRVQVDPSRVHRLEGEDPDRAAAAARYEATLPGRLDLLLLGVGEDGHTASLFPGDPALRETERRVLPVRGPSEPRERLTITPPVIRAARTLVVLAAGARKADAVSAALRGRGDPMQVPARLAARGTWIVDTAAAGGLEDA